ncbi:MAG: hypothetical protein AB1861_27830 [Cyanobacteriota bacterium]
MLVQILITNLRQRSRLQSGYSQVGTGDVQPRSHFSFHEFKIISYNGYIEFNKHWNENMALYAYV